jgi:hypothetical protein
MENKITKIAIFDFDQTLVESPIPETGKIIYKEKTGNEWPHQGWWSKMESLNTEIFDIPLIKSVKDAYDNISKEENTVKILLTGRINKLSKEVEAILRLHGLVFDSYHYNSGGATETFKIKVMGDLLDKYPDVTEMVIWEDRVLHALLFKQFLEAQRKSGRLKKFTVTVVPPDRH